MKAVKCRQCKEWIQENPMWSLRDHWEEEHPGELKAVDRWLGKVDDKARSWERWKREVEEGQVGDRMK